MMVTSLAERVPLTSFACTVYVVYKYVYTLCYRECIRFVKVYVYVLLQGVYRILRYIKMYVYVVLQGVYTFC